MLAFHWIHQYDHISISTKTAKMRWILLKNRMQTIVRVWKFNSKWNRPSVHRKHQIQRLICIWTEPIVWLVWAICLCFVSFKWLFFRSFFLFKMWLRTWMKNTSSVSLYEIPLPRKQNLYLNSHHKWTECRTKMSAVICYKLCSENWCAYQMECLWIKSWSQNVVRWLEKKNRHMWKWAHLNCVVAELAAGFSFTEIENRNSVWIQCKRRQLVHNFQITISCFLRFFPPRICDQQDTKSM